MDEVDRTIMAYDETALDYAKNVKGMVPSGWGCFSGLLKPNSYILDLGCGSGKDARLLVEAGHRVLGVDLSLKLLEIARSDVPLAYFRVLDIRELDFEDDTFDAIWCVASLVHIPKISIDSILNRCYGCLKSEGVMYVSVKSGEGEAMLPDKRYGGEEKFWSFFTKGEIIGYLERNGFEVISDRTVSMNDNYATNPWIDVFCKK